jgi:hypothetical protein
MADFEKAVFSAFEENFPEIVSKGCVFHFSQSLLRNVASEGLRDTYSNDNAFNHWVKRCFSLAFVPPESINSEWAKIKNAKPILIGVDNFIDYFESTYLNENGMFPRSIWNHYHTKGPRTNNHVEGYHLKLKLVFGGTAHQDVMAVLAHLRADWNNAELGWFRSLPPTSEPAPPRNKFNVWKDIGFNDRKQMLAEGRIDLETYTLYNIRNFQMEFTEKKKS